MPAQTAGTTGTTRAPQTGPTPRARGYLPLPGWVDPDSWLAALYAPILPALKRLVKIRRQGARGYEPRDILVPQGFAVELVAGGFTTPMHCCFDDAGACYVVECGHKVDARPRILKVDVRTGRYETFFELPQERWIKTGAVTGACWHQGSLYVANTDTLFRITPDREIEDVVTGLPGLGDHQTNYPLVGLDGMLYWGQGSATNTGVVGADNFAYERLPVFPHFHDVPAQDVTLAGRDYEYRNVLGSVAETVRSGAYVPFGAETRPGQVIRGSVKCTGVQPGRRGGIIHISQNQEEDLSNISMSGLSVQVHIWRNLSYRDLLPLLDALDEHFRDVRTQREAEGPVQAGGLDAGLALTILVGWAGAEVLKTFLSELTKDAYRGLRTQLLRLFPKAAAAPANLHFLPMSITVGSVRFCFEEELTEEEFLRCLSQAAEYVCTLPEQVLLDETPRPPETSMLWDNTTQSWKSGLELARQQSGHGRRLPEGSSQEL